MKTQYRYFVVLVILGVLSFSFSSTAKQSCQKYLNQLHSVQVKQRAGYTIKQGNKLQVQAAKARDQWWRCTKGTLPIKKPKKKSKKQKKTKQKKSHKLKKLKNKKKTVTKEFNISNAITIKNRYKGHQLQAWLNYYQPPKACLRPKTTQRFAYCVEDRQRQQTNFERKY